MSQGGGRIMLHESAPDEFQTPISWIKETTKEICLPFYSESSFWKMRQRGSSHTSLLPWKHKIAGCENRLNNVSSRKTQFPSLLQPIILPLETLNEASADYRVFEPPYISKRMAIHRTREVAEMLGNQIQAAGFEMSFFGKSIKSEWKKGSSFGFFSLQLLFFFFTFGLWWIGQNLPPTSMS
jgi:hypothetical protein